MTDIDKARSAPIGSRWISRGLLIAFTLLSAVALIRFGEYAGRYPYVAIDDALGSVSFTLAHEGRYGNSVSPVQGHGLDRYGGFFNYGPWYFFVGAGVTKVFGWSLVAMRSLHLVALVAIGLLAFFAFSRPRGSTPVVVADRGIGAAVAAAFGSGLLLLFHHAHWPMIRPDSFVSLFAISHLVCLSIAIRRRSPVFWFLAGTLAAMAAWTHLIAASVVVTCAVSYAGAAYFDSRSSERSFVREFFSLRLLAVFGGGLVATVQFFAAAGITVTEYFGWIGIYSDLLESTRTPFEVLGEHLEYAYGTIPALEIALVAALAIGALLGIRALVRRPASGAFVTTDVLPSLVTTVGYGVGLAYYPNHHAGYVILLQVLGLWLGATVAIELLSRISNAAPSISKAVTAITFLVAAGVTMLGGWRISRGQFALYDLASSHPSYDRLTREALEPVPPGGTVWGEVTYGLESPQRAQYVSLFEGVNAADRLPMERRATVAPEHLVWARGNAIHAIHRELQESESLVSLVDEVDPASSYRLVKVVHAPPYQTIRVRERVATADDGPTRSSPRFAGYSARLDRWTRTLDHARAETVAFESESSPSLGRWKDTAPARIAAVGRSATADRTLVAMVEPGVWFVRVDFERPDVGIATVSAGRAAREPWFFLGDQGSYGDGEALANLVGADAAFPFPIDGSNWLAIELRASGPIYFSVVDPDSRVRVTTISLIPALFPDPPVREPDWHALAIPALSEWTATTGLQVMNTDGGIAVIGDDSTYGYQCASPSISVSPKSTIEIELDVDVRSGRIAIGILDERGAWLVPPTEAVEASRPVVRFETARNRAVRGVIANLEPIEPSEFRLTSVSARVCESETQNSIERLLETVERVGED